jgi:hypothetical protein
MPGAKKMLESIYFQYMLTTKQKINAQKLSPPEDVMTQYLGTKTSFNLYPLYGREKKRQ